MYIIKYSCPLHGVHAERNVTLSSTSVYIHIEIVE